jgi:hypothetical protein
MGETAARIGVNGREPRPDTGSRFAPSRGPVAFAPGLHVNYAETLLPMRHGLPKLKDFPAEFGGSGGIIAE